MLGAKLRMWPRVAAFDLEAFATDHADETQPALRIAWLAMVRFDDLVGPTASTDPAADALDRRRRRRNGGGDGSCLGRADISRFDQR